MLLRYYCVLLMGHCFEQQIHGKLTFHCPYKLIYYLNCVFSSFLSTIQKYIRSHVRACVCLIIQFQFISSQCNFHTHCVKCFFFAIFVFICIVYEKIASSLIYQEYNKNISFFQCTSIAYFYSCSLLLLFVHVFVECFPVKNSSFLFSTFEHKLSFTRT